MDLNDFLEGEDTLSPDEFLRLTSTAKGRDNIKSVRFVLPKIGKPNDFGHFKVSYKNLSELDGVSAYLTQLDL